MREKDIINLRRELDKVLEEFNKTSNIQMTLGNATFGSDVTFKLVGNAVVNGTVITKESEDFKSYQHKHGLKLQALNYEFKHEGQTLTVLGYSSRSRKYPIKFKQGVQNFKCSVQRMKAIFLQSAPELLI